MITGNSAFHDGGGISCLNNSSLILENVTIINNNANRGGGFLCSESSPILITVTIADNQAYICGGIDCGYYSSPNLENVTITGNNGSIHFGGGIYCHNNSNISIINSIVSGNNGNYGIFVDEGNPIIEYSNFYNNENGNFYGLNDSIGVNITTNANGDSCDAFYNIQMDPMFVDPSSYDYHLHWGSPCIDAGDPNSPLDPDGTIADMGAYYFNQNVSVDDPENFSDCIIWNFPNPTKNSTTIQYSLKQNSHVMISIYNIKGQLISTLVNETKPKGEYSVIFDTEALSSGVYFYKIQTKDISEIRKMIVIK